MAVLSVVAFHAFPSVASGGFVGVDVFFVISGYLITGILARENEAGTFSIANFYSRRAKRIFPALSIMLASCLAAGWLLMVASDYSRLGEHVAGGASFVANLIFWAEVNYFDAFVLFKPLLHLWSLGVEEQFYIVWPLLIWFLVRYRINIRVVLAALAMMSLAYCLYLTAYDPAAAFYSPLSRFWQLACGGLIAVSVRPDVAIKGANPLSVVGLLLICGSATTFIAGNYVPGWRAILPVAGAGLLIAAGPRSWANRLLSIRPLVWIGLISYPLYLWHWPLLSFAAIANHMDFPSKAIRAAAVVLSFVLAAGTYLLIERPMRRWNALVLGGIMGALFLVGLAIMGSHGVPGRAANKDPKRLLIATYLAMPSESDIAWRQECNFYDWHANQEERAIAPSCVLATGSSFIWGDSHAQAIAAGLRPYLGVLNQVGTSQCAPSLTDGIGEGPPGGPLARACVRANRFALDAISRTKPRIVFIAQRQYHEQTDWTALARELKRRGAGRVVLIGPTPQWLPSLPSVIVHDRWPYIDGPIKDGLDPAALRTDRVLNERYRTSRDLTYVSLIGALCGRNGCQAATDGMLLVSDYGHLTAKGTKLAARIVMQRAGITPARE